MKEKWRSNSYHSFFFFGDGRDRFITIQNYGIRHSINQFRVDIVIKRNVNNNVHHHNESLAIKLNGSDGKQNAHKRTRCRCRLCANISQVKWHEQHFHHFHHFHYQTQNYIIVLNEFCVRLSSFFFSSFIIQHTIHVE